jgi:DNA sulfur modification protein DndB
MSNLKKLALPCLKGKIGDWIYYSTIMTFGEIEKRVKQPKEYDDLVIEPQKLGDWVQRDLEENRIKHIVSYLKNQPQRFFNSIIIGIEGGKPQWKDLELTPNPQKDIFNEETYEYLSRSVGILILAGTERLFAIDGQHRAKGIKDAVHEEPVLASDEISVIFVAHKPTGEGLIRTRRLFSTLNKYAKPVSPSEIIALSEDNNCAIITRDLVDNEPLFKGKILVAKNRSIHPDNHTSFTNIMVLYDIIERLLTDKAVVGIKVSGHPKNQFTTQRTSDLELMESKKIILASIKEIINQIPSISKFFSGSQINRKKKNSSLLFRPIGQLIFFDVYKIGLERRKKKKVLEYFAKDDFNLANSIWNRVFWNSETQSIITEKSRQRYATLLILEHLGISIRRTKKDQEIFDSFNIDPKVI